MFRKGQSGVRKLKTTSSDSNISLCPFLLLVSPGLFQVFMVSEFDCNFPSFPPRLAICYFVGKDCVYKYNVNIELVIHSVSLRKKIYRVKNVFSSKTEIHSSKTIIALKFLKLKVYIQHWQKTPRLGICSTFSCSLD